MKPLSVLPRIGAILILTGIIAACGQKGSLYMPGDKEPKASKSAQPVLPPARTPDAATPASAVPAAETSASRIPPAN